MQLVRVAYCISGIRDGQVGEPQQFGGFGHAVGDQEILGRLSHIFVEDLTEIASVQAAGGCISSTEISFWKFCSMKEIASLI